MPSTDAPARWPPAPTVDRLFRIGFWLLVGAISFSIAGMLLLKLFPAAMSLFGPVYPVLVKTPTWTFMTLLAILPILMYGPTLGWGRIGLFVGWGALMGAAGELVGTMELLTVAGIPLPFGEYQYTSWLGPKIAGHVPYFIPASWFAMSIVSLDLARRITTKPWGSVLLGTTFMVLWDVALDPAMNRAFPFWSYGTDGFFFGMPLSNWGGWFAVSFAVMMGYEWMRGDRQIQNDWAPWVYALNCLFPLAISLLQDLYLAVFIGTLTSAVPFLLIWACDPTFTSGSVSVARS